MELKEKLVALRKEKGLTQLAVAEKLDVSRQAISRWESGVVLPSTDNLRCLSSLYEVPIDYLLKEDSERKSNPDNEPAPDEFRHKNKKTVALIAAALIGILVIGIFCYFLTRNNEKYIDVVDAESDQWNESHAEIEFNEIDECTIDDDNIYIRALSGTDVAERIGNVIYLNGVKEATISDTIDINNSETVMPRTGWVSTDTCPMGTASEYTKLSSTKDRNIELEKRIGSYTERALSIPTCNGCIRSSDLDH